MRACQSCQKRRQQRNCCVESPVEQSSRPERRVAPVRERRGGLRSGFSAANQLLVFAARTDCLYGIRDSRGRVESDRFGQSGATRLSASSK